MHAFSTFHGTVKRLALERLTPRQLNAFRIAFPGYDLLPGELGQAELLLGLQAVRRRFSGAQFVARAPLPRSSYAVVCRDASGEDAGALAQELRAYACPELRAALAVHDVGPRSAKPTRGDTAAGRRWLRIDVQDTGHQLRARFGALGLNQVLVGGAWRTYLPYRLENVSVEGAVDLRLPDMRAWFFETLRFGCPPFWRKHCEASVRNFYDLLPTLMTAELGGNATTDAIGRALRMSGVRALVYPSARTDPESIVFRGQMMSAVGFNLVVFGDELLAGDDEQSMVFDDLDPWGASAFWPSLRCEVAELSGNAALAQQLRGTWRLRGVRAAHERYWFDGGCLGTSATMANVQTTV